jgi:hypothetical protein
MPGGTVFIKNSQLAMADRMCEQKNHLTLCKDTINNLCRKKWDCRLLRCFFLQVANLFFETDNKYYTIGGKMLSLTVFFTYMFWIKDFLINVQPWR